MSSSLFDQGEGEASASPDTLKTLHKTLEEAVQLELLTQQMEADLTAAKSNLHAIKIAKIPDLMAQLGMEQLTWQGWKVKVSDFINGSLPSDPEKREKAILWLENNEGGPLIKTEVKVVFAKSQHEEAMKVAEQLTQTGFAPTLTNGVHSSTLCAWARERIKSGAPLDIDLLGLFTGRVAKFSQVKKP